MRPYLLRPTRPPLQFRRSIDTAPNLSIERPARHTESLSEVRASPRASAPGLFRIRSKSRIPAAFGIANSVLHPRLDNIGATLGHHEAILQLYFYYRWHRLLSRARSRSLHGLPVTGQVRALSTPVPATTALRTLRRRSQANSVWQ